MNSLLSSLSCSLGFSGKDQATALHGPRRDGELRNFTALSKPQVNVLLFICFSTCSLVTLGTFAKRQRSKSCLRPGDGYYAAELFTARLPVQI